MSIMTKRPNPRPSAKAAASAAESLPEDLDADDDSSPKPRRSKKRGNTKNFWLQVDTTNSAIVVDGLPVDVYAPPSSSSKFVVKCSIDSDSIDISYIFEKMEKLVAQDGLILPTISAVGIGDLDMAVPIGSPMSRPGSTVKTVYRVEKVSGEDFKIAVVENKVIHVRISLKGSPAVVLMEKSSSKQPAALNAVVLFSQHTYGEEQDAYAVPIASKLKLQKLNMYMPIGEHADALSAVCKAFEEERIKHLIDNAALPILNPVPPTFKVFDVTRAEKVKFANDGSECLLCKDAISSQPMTVVANQCYTFVFVDTTKSTTNLAVGASRGSNVGMQPNLPVALAKAKFKAQLLSALSSPKLATETQYLEPFMLKFKKEIEAIRVLANRREGLIGEVVTQLLDFDTSRLASTKDVKLTLALLTLVLSRDLTGVIMTTSSVSDEPTGATALPPTQFWPQQQQQQQQQQYQYQQYLWQQQQQQQQQFFPQPPWVLQQQQQQQQQQMMMQQQPVQQQMMMQQQPVQQQMMMQAQHMGMLNMNTNAMPQQYLPVHEEEPQRLVQAVVDANINYMVPSAKRMRPDSVSPQPSAFPSQVDPLAPTDAEMMRAKRVALLLCSEYKVHSQSCTKCGSSSS